MPLEPHHKPQKKRKLITHFPNDRPIPKAMQYMVDKGVKLVESDDMHNYLIDATIKADDDEGPMIEEGHYQLYWVNNTVLIYDTEHNEIWLTKDSDPSDLMPEYWEKLINKL